MRSDRRSILAAGLVAGALGAARAAGQTPPPEAGGPLPPGLPQPIETIDLWPAGAPGMPAEAPEEQTAERSTDTLVADRAVLGITRPRMAVSGRCDQMEPLSC